MTVPHGDPRRYQHDHCRCPHCRTAQRDYMRHRARQQAYGQWAGLVDADPVRSHIRTLIAAGTPTTTIARLTGVSRETVGHLLWGVPSQQRPPTRTMQPGNAARLLACRQAPPRIVPALGTRRRTQTLFAAGWTYPAQAHRLGWTPGALYKQTCRDRILAVHAHAITTLYLELAYAPEPVGPWATRARAYAARLGWQPPAAWEGLDLDDPADPDLPDPSYVDEVAVARVCAGTGSWDALTRAEKAAVREQLAGRGWSTTRITRHIADLRRQHAEVAA